MITKVIMPKMGQTMEEGTIVSWLIEEGEKVQKGDVLLEIETDKAVIEVEAPADGVIRKILYPEGETIAVLEPIAILADADEDIAEVLQELISGEKSQSESPESEPASIIEENAPDYPEEGAGLDSQRVLASPRARLVAEKYSLNLANISGSGPGGRITEKDVLAAAQAAMNTENQEKKIDKSLVQKIPFNAMRRAIARNLTLSKQTIPHFYLKITVDATSLYSLYLNLKRTHQISINDFIIKAVADALAAFPTINSRIDDETQTLLPDINIGIAVSVEDGLQIPVLANADTKSLAEIAEESRILIQKAREGKVSGLGRGTFTISNLGMFGITDFSAVINPPEVAILAVGAMQESVLVENGRIGIGRSICLTLSGDHRAFDGVLGAKFLAHIKKLLETPELLRQA